MTRGFTASICRNRKSSHAAISSVSGLRFPGGLAFQNVADEDVFPAQFHRFDDPGKELSGSPDKGQSLLVFIRARRQFIQSNNLSNSVPPRMNASRHRDRTRCPRRGPELIRQGHLEESEDYDKDEDVVDREGFFDEVPDEKPDGRIVAQPPPDKTLNAPAKAIQRPLQPIDSSIDGDVRMAVKDEQVDRQARATNTPNASQCQIAISWSTSLPRSVERPANSEGSGRHGPGQP